MKRGVRSGSCGEVPTCPQPCQLSPAAETPRKALGAIILGRCRREVPRIFLISSTNSQENLILVRCNVRGRPRTWPLNGGGKNMKRIALGVVLSVFALSTAPAQETCSSKAVGKDGKPLAGAALKSFMTKCTKDACEPKAVDKNGKPLAGAAKASFMKKCESEA